MSSAPTKVPATGASTTGSIPSTTASTTSAAPTTTAGVHSTATPTTHKFSGFTVPAILAWKDPAKTGALFGQAVLAWVVLSSSIALRLFLRLSVYLLLLLAALEFSTRAINGTNNGLIASYRFSRFLPREQAIQNISASVAKNVRSALYGIEYVLDTRDPALNAKLAFGAWILYKVLGLFTVRTLALLAIITTFILPAVYLQFKPQVDQAIGQAQSHLHLQQQKLEKIAHEKAGPQIQFVKKLANKRDRGGLSTGSATTPGHSGASTGLAGSTVPSTGASTGYSQTGASHTGASTSAYPTSGLSSTGSVAGSSAPAVSRSVDSSSTAPLNTHATTGTHSSTGATSHFNTAGVPSSASTLHSANLPTTEEVLSTYDNVPSLAGNVKLDQSRVNQFETDAATLRDSIKQDKSFH